MCQVNYTQRIDQNEVFQAFVALQGKLLDREVRITEVLCHLSFDIQPVKRQMCSRAVSFQESDLSKDLYILGKC